jgi:hypothetical protein
MAEGKARVPELAHTEDHMRRKRYYIIPQRYPDAWGNRPVSFAVYCGREFLCYAFSLARAWQALEFLRQQRNAAITQIGKTPKTPCRF